MCIVTGAASGIGYETFLKISENGGNVVAVDINKDVINIQKKRVFNMHNIFTIRRAIQEVENFGMKPEIMKILWHFIARRE